MTIIRTVMKKANQFLYDALKKTDHDVPDTRKVSLLKGIAREHPECKSFVETGTFFGAMPYALKDTFDTLYTIELDNWLFKKANKKLRYVNNIFCFHGDSPTVLQALLPTIHEPVLYWLDAHYSRGVTILGHEETPIIKELKLILSHEYATDSIIVIDDANCFGTITGYPTIDEIELCMKQTMPNKSHYMNIDMRLDDNIIVIKKK